MIINDSYLFQNLIAMIIVCLIAALIVFLKTKPLLYRLKEYRETKYSLSNNIKRKKKKKKNKEISLGRLTVEYTLCIIVLMYFIFLSYQYWMDYNIKDYQSSTGVVESIEIVGTSKKVKIQGREEPFLISNEEAKLIEVGQTHIIIFAKRTGMILEVK